jgi:hypothetical protein
MVRPLHVLISYSDDVPGDGWDAHLAHQLQHYLQEENIAAQVQTYRETELSTNTYQWLIVIYNNFHALHQPIFATVNTALERVVKRSMQGVLLLTTNPSSEIPREWATIRAYRTNPQNGQAETAHTFDSMVHMMSYAKLPLREYKQHHKLLQPLLRASIQPGGQRTAPITPLRAMALLALLAILLLGTAGLVYLSAGIFAGSHTSSTRLSSASITATALAHATQKPSAVTALPKDPQQLYTTVTASPPTLVGFQSTGLQWDTNQASCIPHNTSYEIIAPQPHQFTPCMAEASSFKNVAYQVTLTTTTDAAGLIFRANSDVSKYYRFSITPSLNTTEGNSTFSIYYCHNIFCTNQQQSEEQPLQSGTLQIKQGAEITLTVIAQEYTIHLYVNGKAVGSPLFVDGKGKNTYIPPVAGKIGVYMSTTTTPGDVTFTRLNVWSLAQKQA